MNDPVLDVLSQLEHDEARVLSWGLVDGGFTRAEFEDRIRNALEQESDGSLTFDGVRDAMLDRGLVVRERHDGTTRYRTRMAETVRLLARLRQLFDGDIDDGGWRGAPTLVSDFRLALSPRRFPRRDIQPADAIARIAGHSQLAGTRRVAAERLLAGHDGSPVQLAAFQVRAAQDILTGISSGASAATIVSAGTGSGKTLAFYLPTLSYVAERVGAPGPQAIAIYPRRELLRDQLTQTYAETRLLNQLQGLPAKLRIGAFFGDTPWNAKHATTKWSRAPAGGLICPYLRCPRCRGLLEWRTADLDLKRERLHCASSDCDTIIGGDEIALTRDAMANQPPNVLFTTTEMLNRSMSNTELGHVFGVGAEARARPRVMLLDEAHTYGGTAGAQTAYLMRRWRHACGTPVHFVGLSATLRDARRFFADLVGLPETAVTEVAPAPNELHHEGMEYQVALRGDAASGTSLLSTTIQTLMLMRRVLDPSRRGPSGGAYGSKVFAFTDALDVVNRLFHNYLDAEGVWPEGKHKRWRTPLAALRSPVGPDAGERREAGQSWDLSAEIGHALDARQRLYVTRTTSQDPNVEDRSDVVVATASLEVGYNDPAVGAVVQHKAPRDVAQFLQRKGRAGRPTEMRPWTVVVLSDYGRDRLTYQNYDALFDPELPPRSLPISNRAVLKMQATYSLLDWISERLAAEGAVPKGSVWNELTGPLADDSTRWGARTRNRQGAIVDLLADLLRYASLQHDLRVHLRKALRMERDDVDALLWEPPRAIIPAVVPTALRRLSSDWFHLRLGEQADQRATTWPLPDFLAASLFSDLDLPELTLVLPSGESHKDREPRMALAQGLREFAPGRVSRRYAVSDDKVRHWIPIATDGGDQDLDITQWCTHFEELGRFHVRNETGHTEYIRCVRPWRFDVERPPAEVVDSSHASLVWRTQILRGGDPFGIKPPKGSPWSDLVRELEFHTHAEHSSATVRRFATGSEAETRTKDGRSREARTRLMLDQDPVGIGFTIDVDAMAVRHRVPKNLIGQAPPEHLAGLRTAMFLERAQASECLAEHGNQFSIGWLSQIYLSALVAVATDEEIDSAHDAVERLHAGNTTNTLLAALEVIFQTIPRPDDRDDGPGDGEEAEGTTGNRARAYTRERLEALCRSPDIVAELRHIAETLSEPPNHEWETFARDRFRATLGAAVVSACQDLCPEFDLDSEVVCDLDPGPPDPGGEPRSSTGKADEWQTLWLTETTVGGGGVIEEVASRCAGDPRGFFRLLEAALRPSDLEVVDAELRNMIQLASGDPELAQAMGAVRQAPGHDARLECLETLLRLLTTRGVFTSHPVVAAINARILQPGSNAAVDEYSAALLARWTSLEARLGFELPLRVFAHIASDESDLDGRLGVSVDGDRRRWAYNQISSMLWPRGWAIRAQGLALYNPYARMAPTDRLLLRRQLTERVEHVALTESDWREAAARELVATGSVVLETGAGGHHELRAAVVELIGEPVDTGSLHLYPRLAGISRADGAVLAELELEQAVS